MKSNVLYFPYIKVPQTTWLTQMLLYWDQVSSIVPYDYIEAPEALGPYMQGLVQEGLIRQVIPGTYVSEMPRFNEPFLAYLSGLGTELDRRRESFKLGVNIEIHIEKMGNVADALVNDFGLARATNYPWYTVESETGDDFMSYLAVVLGQLESIDSLPVTDKPGYFRRIVGVDIPPNNVEQQLAGLRIQVLNKVLPVPNAAVTAPALRAFRDRYGVELGDFRRRVERELVAAVNISDISLRQHNLDLFYDESRARTAEIKASMRGAGWTVAKSGLSVIAAIPGVSPSCGLVSAIWEALSGRGAPQLSRDFAYAAYVGKKLS